ncbi:hypothetical protein ScPMuIL_008383 [Solemya velum]
MTMRPTMGLSGLLLFLVTAPMFWVETEGGGIHKPGVCTLWGEPHVVTFDGKYYHHTGICEYVVARDQCSTNGTWTFLVTAKMIQVNRPVISRVFFVKVETDDAVIDMGWGFGNIGVWGFGFLIQYIGPDVRCLHMFLLLAVVVVCTFLSRATGGWTSSILECRDRMEKCVVNCYKNPCYESCFRVYSRCLDSATNTQCKMLYLPCHPEFHHYQFHAPITRTVLGEDWIISRDRSSARTQVSDDVLSAFLLKLFGSITATKIIYRFDRLTKMSNHSN